MKNLSITTLSEEQIAQILKYKNGDADIAFVLTESKDGFVAPAESIEFVKFLEDHQKIDIYGDSDQTELYELRSVIIDIGLIIVTTTVAPILLNLVSNYLYDYFKDRKDKQTSEFKFSIVVDEGNKKIQCDYSGSVEDGIKALETVGNIVESQNATKDGFNDERD